MGNNNLFDKFIERYDNINDRNQRTEYRRITKKPSKFESVVGFIFTLVILVILIRFFSPTKMYFVIFIGNLVIMAYYGVNLFTKKGFGLPATVEVLVDREDNENQRY